MPEIGQRSILEPGNMYLVCATITRRLTLPPSDARMRVESL